MVSCGWRREDGMGRSGRARTRRQIALTAEADRLSPTPTSRDTTRLPHTCTRPSPIAILPRTDAHLLILHPIFVCDDLTPSLVSCST